MISSLINNNKRKIIKHSNNNTSGWAKSMSFPSLFVKVRESIEREQSGVSIAYHYRNKTGHVLFWLDCSKRAFLICAVLWERETRKIKRDPFSELSWVCVNGVLTIQECLEWGSINCVSIYCETLFLFLSFESLACCVCLFFLARSGDLD